MNCKLLFCSLLATLCGLFLACSARADVTFGSGVNQFTMAFTTIGSPGNAADTTGAPRPAGAVGYTYQIGTYEVSRDMINKVNAATGNLDITMQDMTRFGGNDVNRPATGISWNEAARFVNWLNTSQGFAPAYSFLLNPGDVGYSADANIQLWPTSDPAYIAANPFRNRGANYFLSSSDEWYKAAYFNPKTNTYSNYPNGSDSAPMADDSGTAPNTAVYSQPVAIGPADVNLAGGLSPFGVMGLGGNAPEWQETDSDKFNDNPESYRQYRGGNWANNASNFLSTNLNGNIPTDGDNFLGFRVVSLSTAPVPELGTLCGWSTICLCVSVYTLRRRRLQAA